ncbi:MAG: DUF4393 domain-containing protein [Defluviitaleaceae bacterium]|nr:DUF4393 domain-containing protein [Defluviitaleaceae bacterium]
MLTLLASEVVPTQTPPSNIDELVVFEIIIIPLIISFIAVITSVITAYLSYRFSKKSGHDKLIYDAIKRQHDSVVVPIYQNLKSDDSFESIIIKNNSIVDDNIAILSPDFLRTYNNAREKTQIIYTKAVEFIYDYTADMLKYNSLDKAINKANKFLKKEEKLKIKRMRKESKNSNNSIFELLFIFADFITKPVIIFIDFISKPIFGFIDFIVKPLNIYISEKEAYQLSLQKLIINKLNDSLESIPVEEPTINDIINTYNDEKIENKKTINNINPEKKKELFNTITKTSLAITDFLPLFPPLATSLSLINTMSNIVNENKKKNEWINAKYRIENEELQSIWGNLVSSATTDENLIHPRMIETLKIMSKDDAIIFFEIVAQGDSVTYKDNIDNKILFSLENLEYFGLIKKSTNEKSTTYKLTLFGKKLADTICPETATEKP